MVVAGGRGREKWELLLNGHEGSILQDEEVSGMDDGDGSTNVNVFNATELYTKKGYSDMI